VIFLSRRGSATVFTAVIMPVVIGACVLLSDACLFDSGSRIIENSVGASAYSILGKYSGYLKENYDLYAYCMNQEVAKSIAVDNLKSNLGNSGMFDFNVEDISVMMGNKLIDIGNMLPMLEKIAADDVYKSLIDEFLDRFNVLSGVAGTAEIITLKMKLDKAYQNIKDSMHALKKIINGDNDLEYYVNMTGLDSEFTDAVSRFNEYRLQLKSIEQEILNLCEELNGEPSEKAGLKTLLEEQAGIVRQKAAEVYTSFIEGFIQGLREANEEAIGYVKNIFIENTNIHIISESIKNRIEKIQDCPVYLKEILKACTELISDIEESFFEQVFEEIKKELDSNISMLSGLRDIFNSTIEEGTQADLDAGEIPVSGYNSCITYLLEDDAVPGRGEDQRGFFESLGKKVLEKQIGGEVKIGDDIILPSMGAGSDSSDFSATSLGEDTEASENEIYELSESVDSVGSKIIRNLAINEYILQHFNYENPKTDGKPEKGFFGNEIEYMLWGLKSQNSNIFFTKTAIMSTRFVLDTIHVYTDSGKCARANAIAAATAGWWTMGSGIPVMSNLIKISWAIAEAGADTGRLWNGESVPIIKNKGDWITDIGLGGTGSITPEFLKMDYGDYLRLYLSAVPIDKKILRILDIISLNSPADFNIYEAYTEITVTAVVSFRSLTGGRHEVEISVTESY